MEALFLCLFETLALVQPWHFKHSEFPYTPMLSRLTVPAGDIGQSGLAMEAAMHREQGAVLEQQ